MNGLTKILFADTEQNRARKARKLFREVAAKLGDHSDAIKFMGVSRGSIDKMNKGQLSESTSGKILRAHKEVIGDSDE